MRQGLTSNTCYRTGEVVAITKDSCRLCRGSISDGRLEVVEWSRRHGGWLTSQTARENLKKRFGGVRSKRCQVSVSVDVKERFFAAVPECERRKRLDHALLVEIGEDAK